MKDGFKSDNVLYIIRGLHQDHMFLIKDMSTFSRKEFIPLVLPLSDNAKDDFLIYHNIFQYLS